MSSHETVTVSGPITGGVHGWPFAGAAFDLAAKGYVEEEWFFEGDAVIYRHAEGTGLSRDGRWRAEEDGKAPFKTRILIRRPIDPARFNGTVVLMWNNVSRGFDLLAGESPEIYDGGFIFAGVSAQPAGVHGFPGADTKPLTAWDPERYGSLSVPSNDASYDIYTKAAELTRSGRLGFAAERVLALGASQSAVFLATYLNAVQPLTHAVDGMLLEIFFGNAVPLQMPVQQLANGPKTAEEIDAAVAMMPPGAHQLRADLDIPILLLNSESEATLYRPVRQPDTARFRFWEIAGASHAPKFRDTPGLPSSWSRDFGEDSMPVQPPADANEIIWENVRSAALRHVQRWLTDGIAPPVQPRIEFDESEVIRRDAHGIATGGIRLPDIAVPRARHSGLAPDGTLRLYGSSIPFGGETLRRLYPDDATYRAKWLEAQQAALDAGVIRPEDARTEAPSADETER